MKIKELFVSIQGEGPYIGYKQVFIRLCGCNLDCKYCDTDFEASNAKEYSLDELVEFVKQNSDCHSVSLTGGEPLLQKGFIKDFAKKSLLPLYLETNATLPDALKDVVDYVTYVSADIKLPSATGMKECWGLHDKFFEIASKKILFAKVVFDSEVTEDEIKQICKLTSKYDIELVLQPMMNGKIPSVSSDFMLKVLDKALLEYKNVRLIPQVHKFIDVI